MEIRPALLIALAFLAVFSARPAPAASPGCLRCHPAHHETHGSCTHCHRGNESAAREEIAHIGRYSARHSHFRMEESTPLRLGRKVLESSGCRRCHVIGGKGMRLSSDLDALPHRAPPEQIAGAILLPAWYMPDFGFGQDAVDGIVNAILAGAGNPGRKATEVPVKVHFSEQVGEDVFSSRCGGCHKALTARYGGLGKGGAAPNLSSLFSAEYPAADRKGSRWTRERLRDWIRNPRKDRALARMPPLRLNEGELASIAERLEVPLVPSDCTCLQALDKR